MKIVITGATGLVGRRLVVDRARRGDAVLALSRSASRAAEQLRRDLADAKVDASKLEVIEADVAIPGTWQERLDDVDAIVHLAGASIAGRRWSESWKDEIVRSRLDSTFQIIESIRSAVVPPRVLVSASAVGWYGATGTEAVDESRTTPGNDFLAELCVQWEAIARDATSFGVRVVPLRFGNVLDARGGLLAKLLPIFRLGIGGRLGSGRQFMPWIHWRDLIALIDWSLRTAALDGAVNATTPTPVSNREFTRALARALDRPAFLPVPRLALRIVMGELAQYALMSQRVVPARAIASGFDFRFGDLESALTSLLDPASAALDDLSSGGAVVAPSRVVGHPPRATDDDDDAETTPRDDSPDRDVPPTTARIVFIAADGALIRREGVVPGGVGRACRAAVDGGAAVVLCTTGAPRGIEPLRDALELTGPLIVYGGAVIWHSGRRDALLHRPLPEAIAREIVQRVRAADPDAQCAFERLDAWTTDRPGAERAAAPAAVESIETAAARELSAITVVTSTPARLPAVREALRPEFWEAARITVFQPRPGVLQIVTGRVDFATAAQQMAGRIGGAEAAVAIADVVTASGLLDWAGFGIVPDDAPDALRRLAAATVEPTDGLAVMRAIHRYVVPNAAAGGERV